MVEIHFRTLEIDIRTVKEPSGRLAPSFWTLEPAFEHPEPSIRTAGASFQAAGS
jgi:hypothetical protein